MTKIKICGLRREEDIVYANACRPDYVGFVFADSKRKVTKEQAKVLRENLLPEITPVGVFVNEEMDAIADLVWEGVIDMVQLHGDETEKDVEYLRRRVRNVPIIKAVRVGKKEDLEGCDKTQADYLLFDSNSFHAYGGTGKTFDWKLIEGIAKPFFLAGGISPENVREAVQTVHPYAVDVSSAVETDGFKDQKKMIELVGRVRKG